MCLIMESEIRSVVDPSEGKKTTTSFFKQMSPDIMQHTYFFPQPDNFVLSQLLLVSGSFIFHVYVSYLPTADVSAGEAYGKS